MKVTRRANEMRKVKYSWASAQEMHQACSCSDQGDNEIVMR